MNQRRLADIVSNLGLWIVDPVRGDGGDEDDTTGAALILHVPSGCLGAQERAGGVDVQGSAPFGGKHVHGVGATNDTGKATQDVNAAKRRRCRGSCGIDGSGICHVGLLDDDGSRGKISAQRFDGVTCPR